MLRNHGLWGKHNCAYDEVWRIPLLIRYPGQKEAKTDNRLVNSTDFLPTCLDAAYENKAMWETCQAKRVRMQEKLIEHLLPEVLA